jgi:hypothetical protein
LNLAAALALTGIAQLAPFFARAEGAEPANTLMGLRRAFGACLAHTPIAAGSRVTIMFMTKRDGSIFGRPRITYAHLEGDAEAQRRFLDEAERAVDSCLPLKVTPALGEAIAGRLFTITLGREKAEPRLDSLPSGRPSRDGGSTLGRPLALTPRENSNFRSMRRFIL